MDNRIEKAVDLIENGDCNCGQAVLCAFAENAGVDFETAKKLSNGLGGGMHVGEMCGAMTAVTMLIGCSCEDREECCEEIGKAVDEFTAKYKALCCREIRESEIGDCFQKVRDASAILSRYLEKAENKKQKQGLL